MKRLTLIILFLLILLTPVMAQEATEPAAAATVESAPITIINEAPLSQETDGSLWGYVLVIGGVIVTGFVSLSFVLQGIGNRAAQAASNPLELQVLEKGFDGIPSSVVKTIIDPLRQSLERSDEALRRMIDLFERVSDDKVGNVAPTPSAPDTNTSQFTSTATTDIAGRESRLMPPPDTPLTQA